MANKLAVGRRNDSGKAGSSSVEPNKSDSTNQKILDAAEQLFAEKSYEATTLREIAKKVGIREPSIYAHFSNKEAIYGAVIDRALSPFLSELNIWNTADLTLRELNDIPRKLMGFHAQHPYSAQILHKEFCNPAQRISPKIMSWLDEITAQSFRFMAGLPDYAKPTLNKQKVVVNIITLTHVTLGYFSSQGMAANLLGDDYDQDALFEEQIKLVTKLFKSLLL